MSTREGARSTPAVHDQSTSNEIDPPSIQERQPSHRPTFTSADNLINSPRVIPVTAAASSSAATRGAAANYPGRIPTAIPMRPFDQLPHNNQQQQDYRNERQNQQGRPATATNTATNATNITTISTTNPQHYNNYVDRLVQSPAPNRGNPDNRNPQEQNNPYQRGAQNNENYEERYRHYHHHNPHHSSYRYHHHHHNHHYNNHPPNNRHQNHRQRFQQASQIDSSTQSSIEFTLPYISSSLREFYNSGRQEPAREAIRVLEERIKATMMTNNEQYPPDMTLDSMVSNKDQSSQSRPISKTISDQAQSQDARGSLTDGVRSLPDISKLRHHQIMSVENVLGVTDPDIILKVFELNPNLDFVFLSPILPQSDPSYSPYLMHVVAPEELDMLNYCMVSRQHAIRYTKGHHPSIQTLDRWKFEQNILHKLRTIPIIQHFKKLKAFNAFSRNLDMRSMARAGRRLRSDLFLCDPLLADTLVLGRAMCLDMADLAMVSIDWELTYSLGEFVDEQALYLREKSSRLDRYLNILMHLTLSSCWDDVMAAGLAVEMAAEGRTTHRRAQESKKKEREKKGKEEDGSCLSQNSEVDKGSWAPDLDNNRQVEKARRCARLLRFVYLMDCLICDTLHTIFINSLQKTENFLNVQHSSFPSSEDIQEIVRSYCGHLHKPKRRKRSGSSTDDSNNDDGDDDDDDDDDDGRGSNKSCEEDESLSSCCSKREAGPSRNAGGGGSKKFRQSRGSGSGSTTSHKQQQGNDGSSLTDSDDTDGDSVYGGSITITDRHGIQQQLRLTGASCKPHHHPQQQQKEQKQEKAKQQQQQQQRQQSPRNTSGYLERHKFKIAGSIDSVKVRVSLPSGTNTAANPAPSTNTTTSLIATSSMINNEAILMASSAKATVASTTMAAQPTTSIPQPQHSTNTTLNFRFPSTHVDEANAATNADPTHTLATSESSHTSSSLQSTTSSSFSIFDYLSTHGLLYSEFGHLTDVGGNVGHEGDRPQYHPLDNVFHAPEPRERDGETPNDDDNDNYIDHFFIQLSDSDTVTNSNENSDRFRLGNSGRPSKSDNDEPKNAQNAQKERKRSANKSVNLHVSNTRSKDILMDIAKTAAATAAVYIYPTTSMNRDESPLSTSTIASKSADTEEDNDADVDDDNDDDGSDLKRIRAVGIATNIKRTKHRPAPSKSKAIPSSKPGRKSTKQDAIQIDKFKKIDNTTITSDLASSSRESSSQHNDDTPIMPTSEWEVSTGDSTAHNDFDLLRLTPDYTIEFTLSPDTQNHGENRNKSRQTIDGTEPIILKAACKNADDHNLVTSQKETNPFTDLRINQSNDGSSRATQGGIQPRFEHLIKKVPSHSRNKMFPILDTPASNMKQKQCQETMLLKNQQAVSYLNSVAKRSSCPLLSRIVGRGSTTKSKSKYKGTSYYDAKEENKSIGIGAGKTTGAKHIRHESLKKEVDNEPKSLAFLETDTLSVKSDILNSTIKKEHNNENENLITTNLSPKFQQRPIIKPPNNSCFPFPRESEKNGIKNIPSPTTMTISFACAADSALCSQRASKTVDSDSTASDPSGPYRPGNSHSYARLLDCSNTLTQCCKSQSLHKTADDVKDEIDWDQLFASNVSKKLKVAINPINDGAEYTDTSWSIHLNNQMMWKHLWSLNNMSLPTCEEKVPNPDSIIYLPTSGAGPSCNMPAHGQRGEQRSNECKLPLETAGPNSDLSAHQIYEQTLIQDTPASKSRVNPIYDNILSSVPEKVPNYNVFDHLYKTVSNGNMSEPTVKEGPGNSISAPSFIEGPSSNMWCFSARKEKTGCTSATTLKEEPDSDTCVQTYWREPALTSCVSNDLEESNNCMATDFDLTESQPCMPASEPNHNVYAFSGIEQIKIKPIMSAHMYWDGVNTITPNPIQERGPNCTYDKEVNTESWQSTIKEGPSSLMRTKMPNYNVPSPFHEHISDSAWCAPIYEKGPYRDLPTATTRDKRLDKTGQFSNASDDTVVQFCNWEKVIADNGIKCINIKNKHFMCSSNGVDVQTIECEQDDTVADTVLQIMPLEARTRRTSRPIDLDSDDTVPINIEEQEAKFKKIYEKLEHDAMKKHMVPLHDETNARFQNVVFQNSRLKYIDDKKKINEEINSKYIESDIGKRDKVYSYSLLERILPFHSGAGNRDGNDNRCANDNSNHSETMALDFCTNADTSYGVSGIQSGASGSEGMDSAESSSLTRATLKPAFHISLAQDNHKTYLIPDVHDFVAMAYTVMRDIEQTLQSFSTLTESPTFNSFTNNSATDGNPRDANNAKAGPSLEYRMARDFNIINLKNNIYDHMDAMFHMMNVFTKEMNRLYRQFFQPEPSKQAITYKDISFFAKALNRLDTQMKILERLPDSQRVGMFLVDLSLYRDNLKQLFSTEKDTVHKDLNQELNGRIHMLVMRVMDVREVLESQPLVTDCQFRLLSFIDHADFLMNEMEKKEVPVIAAMYDLIDRYGVPHEQSNRSEFESCHSSFEMVRTLQGQTRESRREEVVNTLEYSLSRDEAWIESQVNKVVRPLIRNPCLYDGNTSWTTIERVLARAEMTTVDLVAKANFVRRAQRYLRKPESQFADLFRTTDAYTNLRNAWLLLKDWETKVTEWKTMEFVELNVSKLNFLVFQYMEACRRLGSRLPPNTVLQVLEDKMDLMLKWLNFIIEFRSYVIKPRHWRQIEEMLGVEFGPTLPLTLGNLMSVKAIDKQKALHMVLNRARVENNVQSDFDEVVRQCQTLVIPIQTKDRTLVSGESAIKTYQLADSFELEEALNYLLMELERIDMSPQAGFLHEDIEARVHQIFEVLEVLVVWTEFTIKLARLRRLILRNANFAQSQPEDVAKYRDIYVKHSEFLARIRAHPLAFEWCRSNEVHEFLHKNHEEATLLIRRLRQAQDAERQEADVEDRSEEDSMGAWVIN